MMRTFPSLSELEEWIREGYTITHISGGLEPVPFNIYFLDNEEFVLSACRNTNDEWVIITDE